MLLTLSAGAQFYTGEGDPGSLKWYSVQSDNYKSYIRKVPTPSQEPMGHGLKDTVSRFPFLQGLSREDSSIAGSRWSCIP